MKVEILNKIKSREIDKELIEHKVEKLKKYFHTITDNKCKVVVKEYNHTEKVEITFSNQYFTVRSESESKTYEESLDHAVKKIEDQLRRQKTRMSKKYHDALKDHLVFDELETMEEEQFIIKQKLLEAEYMSVEEAMMQMDLINHDFFIFTDSENDKKSVVYKRKSSGYGLIAIE